MSCPIICTSVLTKWIFTSNCFSIKWNMWFFLFSTLFFNLFEKGVGDHGVRVKICENLPFLHIFNLNLLFSNQIKIFRWLFLNNLICRFCSHLNINHLKLNFITNNKYDWRIDSHLSTLVVSTIQWISFFWIPEKNSSKYTFLRLVLSNLPKSRRIATQFLSSNSMWLHFLDHPKNIHSNIFKVVINIFYPFQQFREYFLHPRIDWLDFVTTTRNVETTFIVLVAISLLQITTLPLILFYTIIDNNYFLCNSFNLGLLDLSTKWLG